MRVNVRLFAVARQLAGRDVVELELPEGSTIGELRLRLAAELPDLAAILSQVHFALDSEYVRDEQPLRPGGDVACIPPVSGG